MAKTYTVTAPLAIVRNTQQGGRQEYLYQGSVLPGYVSSEEAERLVEAGLVASQSDAEEAGVTPATSPDQLNVEVLVAPGKEQPAKEQPAKTGGKPSS